MRAKYVSIEVASARDVAERWKKQYYDSYDKDPQWMNVASGNSEDVYNKLCELGVNPPLDKVADIIGNKSWSYISCDGCSDYIERGVRIRADYDEGKVYCKTCIDEAHQVLFGEAK